MNPIFGQLLRPMNNTSSAKKWLLSATSISYIIVILDTSIVNVALAPLAAALHSTISGLQWVVSSYTITFASLLLSGGALGDKLGAKNVYLTGLLLFGFASAGCGFSSTLSTMIFSRILQGIGAALLVPASLALINSEFPQSQERAKAIGIWAGCGGIAMAAGPLFGGLLIQLLGWRSIFLVNVPIVLLGIVLATRIPAIKISANERTMDIAGQLFAIIALGLSIAVLIEGGHRGWCDPWICGGVLVAAMAWGLFIFTERTISQPMLPMKLFRLADFSASVTVSLISGLVFYGLFFLLSLYFETVRGWSSLDAGLAFLPLTLLVTLGSFSAGKLNRLFGPLWLIAGCCGLYVAGFTGLLILRENAPYWRVAVCFPALGLAAGVITPVATAAVMGSIVKEQAGIVAGVLNASRQTGAALGVAIFGGLLSAVKPLAAGIYVAVCLGIAFSMLGGLLWIIILSRNLTHEKNTP
ncbi:MFS transporter [Pectobacterium odoriferum]|uniref:MFS transporter n=1 Tax=Pectobacterium odoriferum TaxID=78398 RepID=A0ABR4VNR9_9GAMM|nr:MFS transporter [Pectobacterium odoriferum]KGA41013.1 MFS transporter [Pectobacterium odoriferum]POE09409.1 MFS transporter [Pectobacterium odoriferum]